MKLKEKLRSGQTCIGTWLQIGSADIAEIASSQGYDWCAVDMEHTDIDLQTMANMFRAIRLGGAMPLVRVSSGNAMDIRRPLDLGAMGVIVPLVETAEQAREIISYVKYPPLGKRGAAFCRVNQWGASFNEYVRTSNEDVLLIVMIESKSGITHIEDILALEGVDGVFVGPYDLSCSYGVPGEVNGSSVNGGLKKVVEACKKYRKTAGQHIVTPTEESVASAISQGYTFLALGMDTIFLRQGFASALKMAEKK